MGGRKATPVVAATIAAVAILIAGVFGIRHLEASRAAAVTPPPTSSSVTTTTTPAPSPAATERPVQEANIDDATVEARIIAPRTGETWAKPTPAPEMASVLAKGRDGWVPYLVGHRGAASIYVVVDEGFATMIAEVDASGAREILCPSARSTDPCLTSEDVPGVVLDTSTFYDSLTLPASVDIGAGWTFETAARRARSYDPAFFLLHEVDPSVQRYGSEYLPVASIGELRVVEWIRPAPDDSIGDILDVRSYALVAPTGVMSWFDHESIPGYEYESIRWDDGVTRTEDATFGEKAYAAGSRECSIGDFSVQADLDRSQWTRSGQTREGAPVYVPTKDNPLVHTIRAMQSAVADREGHGDGYPGRGESRAYPFASDAAFRDAHALFAIAGPDGVWQLRLRGDAIVLPFGCSD